MNMSSWKKPILQVLLGQAAMQCLSLAITFIVVRILDKEQYGIYTVITSVQAMILSLSTSGMMIGFQKLVGEHWRSDEQLSSLISSGTSVRRFILIPALAVSYGYAIAILGVQHVHVSTIIGALLLITVIISPEIQGSFITNILLVKKNIKTCQIYAVLVPAVRLVLILTPTVIGLKLGLFGILSATAIGSLTAYAFLLRKTSPLRYLNPVRNEAYTSELWHYVRINWHNSAFYVFRGQISIFLIGLFGTTTKMADLGAISRYGLAMTAFTALASNLFIPAYAREKVYRRLKLYYLAAMGGWMVLALAIVTFVYFFSEPLLWLLGPRYQHLNKELVLVFISSLLGVANAISHGVNATKGWISITRYFEIPVHIVGIILGVFLYDISTVDGILYFSIQSVAIGLTLSLLNGATGLRSWREPAV